MSSLSDVGIAPIRVYFDGVRLVGYYEGDSCGSVTDDDPDLDSIVALSKRLEKQTEEVGWLLEIIDMIGLKALKYLFEMVSDVYRVKEDIRMGKEYDPENKKQGTHWKQCFLNMKELEKDLAFLISRLSSQNFAVDSLLKKYLESANPEVYETVFSSKE